MNTAEAVIAVNDDGINCLALVFNSIVCSVDRNVKVEELFHTDKLIEAKFLASNLVLIILHYSSCIFSLFRLLSLCSINLLELNRFESRQDEGELI